MKTASETRKAIEMPSTAVGLVWKSWPIVGNATFTIVTSMMLMNIAATNTTLTATFSLIRTRIDLTLGLRRCAPRRGST